VNCLHFSHWFNCWDMENLIHFLLFIYQKFIHLSNMLMEVYSSDTL
jgi:hypothetical protein